MRCACIDVGSNTTRLLVADYATDGLAGVVNEREFTLIGRSLDDGRIPAEKIDETAAVVARLAGQARELGAERVRAVATAAIRRAANAAELVSAVERQAKVALEVLPGEEEARLAFRGAAHMVGGHGLLAVVDVGGGSTEVAIGEPGGDVREALSFPVGSALLAERYLGSDPPRDGELAEVREAVARELAGFDPPDVKSAVAVGGSASSLRQLAGDCLDSERLTGALDLLRVESAAVVASRFGLAPERVRLLPAGLILLAELSVRLGRSLRVCKGGLREGVILEMLGNPT